MKKLLIIVILVSSSFASSTLIGDFAPTTVGSKWVYFYKDGPGMHSEPIPSDSLIIQIEAISKEKKGKDTLVLLKIIENGKSFSPIGLTLPTQINDTFIDSAIISDDSIYKSSSYQCKVFPFWNQHNILSDSLKRVKLRNDTLFVFSLGNDTTFPFVSYSSYLQGIGLYSLISVQLMSSMDITLISFNNKPIPVETKFPSKNALEEKATLCNKTFKTKLITKGSKLFATGYLLNGKKTRATGNVSSGIILTNGSNQAILKNP
jgi:hypothetical protein